MFFSSSSSGSSRVLLLLLLCLLDIKPLRRLIDRTPWQHLLTSVHMIISLCLPRNILCTAPAFASHLGKLYIHTKGRETDRKRETERANERVRERETRRDEVRRDEKKEKEKRGSQIENGRAAADGEGATVDLANE